LQEIIALGSDTHIHFEWHEAFLALVSFCLCWALVIIAPKIPRLYGRAHLEAVQASHSKPTPRVGGIAIFGSLAISVIFVPSEITWSYSLFIVAASVIFIVGLAEDLGFGVSPLRRLCAVCLASVLAIWFLGVWLPRLDIPGLDGLMTYAFVGVPFTLLVTAGIANGFNLIDGVNGLASLTAIAAAIALGLIAERAGYSEMVHLSTLLAAGIFGFFMINYPYGLIFLGDAGAYTIGFVLSWFGIAVLLNAPEVSPWAILLTMFWPLADTLLAIYRRARGKVATMAPDRLHVHQLVMRALEIYVLGRGKREITNPLSTLILAPFVAAPPVVGVLFWNQTTLAFLSVVGFLGLFFGSYALAFKVLRLLKHKGCSPDVTRGIISSPIDLIMPVPLKEETERV
jgi:UDP-GlcNAc:undecaprenyl-phosphate GlcNAc-1-phosphate transferase